MRIRTILFAFALATLFVQPLQAQFDFEDPALVDQQTLYDFYWNEPCGVRFYMDGDTNQHPQIARVGLPRTAFYGVTGTACNSTQTNADMPAPGEDVGCQFLTDDGDLSGPSGILWVEYRTPTDQASGELLDIDFNEAWQIQALDANLTPLFTTVLAAGGLDHNNLPTGNGIASYWEIDLSNSGQQFTFITFQYVGTTGNVGLAFDNFNACGVTQATCCGGENIVANGDFENAQATHLSDYSQETTIAANSVAPGEWALVNEAQAAAISPNWNVQDAGGCAPTQQFLVVNGLTGGSTNPRSIWRQQVTYEPGETYRFCAYFKNLPQCAFDIQPRIGVAAAGAQPTQYSIINTDPNDPCDWQYVELDIPTTGSGAPQTVWLHLYLIESGFGDGNDLAIDDISVEKIEAIDPMYSLFTVLPGTVDPNTGQYAVNAWPNQPAPSGDCSYSWSICEIDGNGNCISGTSVIEPAVWDDDIPTTFPGYVGSSILSGTANGEFFTDRNYYAQLTIDCDCGKPSSSFVSWGILNGKLYINGVEQPANRMGNTGGEIKEEKQKASGGGFEVFPNPTTGWVTVQRGTRSTAPATLKVVNMEGQVVLEAEMERGQPDVRLDLSGVASGMYLVHMREGEAIQFRKVMVEGK